MIFFFLAFADRRSIFAILSFAGVVGKIKTTGERDVDAFRRASSKIRARAGRAATTLPARLNRLPGALEAACFPAAETVYPGENRRGVNW